MPIQVRGVLVHAISGTELSRVRTEFRLRLPEPINKSPLESRGADIVMQSCPVLVLQMSGKGVCQDSERSVHQERPKNAHQQSCSTGTKEDFAGLRLNGSVVVRTNPKPFAHQLFRWDRYEATAIPDRRT